MSAPARTAATDTPEDVARALLATRLVGRLPVVDRRGRPVGIVCRRDLLVFDLAAEYPDSPDACDEAADRADRAYPDGPPAVGRVELDVVDFGSAAGADDNAG